MKVSVIIPTLNEAEALPRTIDSVWSAGADEVLVVDGGSTDGSPAIAKAHRATVLEAPRGRAGQQNHGARAADGDVLLFQHADNWISPRAIAQIREALVDDAIAGGAFCQKIEADGFRFRWLERGNAWRVRRRHLAYGDQSLFVRAETFFALGGFPDVPFLEDYIFMEAFRRRFRPVLLPGPVHVNARRWQETGVLRQTARNWTLITLYRLGVSPERLAAFYS